MSLLTRFALVAVAAVGTAATFRREGAGPAMAGGCGYCSSGPCVPTGSLSTFYQTDVPGKNAKLRLTVTIPGTSDSFRNPFPVIFFFNGFQVRTINEPSTPENTASLTPYVHGNVASPVLLHAPDAHSRTSLPRYSGAGARWLLPGLCRADGLMGFSSGPVQPAPLLDHPRCQ